MRLSVLRPGQRPGPADPGRAHHRRRSPVAPAVLQRLIDDIRGGRPGMTVLVATAYMEEAERFERLVALDAGRILADGTTAEVLARAGAATLDEAFAALQGETGAGPRTPAGAARRHGRGRSAGHSGGGADAPVREIHRRRSCQLPSRARRDFRFLGSNGCGKTTTMKMLTGLLPASEGRAELLGRPVERATSIPACGSATCRSRSSVRGMSVRANLDLHARLYRIPAGEVGPRTRRWPGSISPMSAGIRPASLPLGIRQRLQLAAACLHRPEVLILDEPTSGVDPAARDMFWRHLGELARRGRRDHLRLDPFHERGRTVRPHLADACRPDPGGRDAPGNPRGPGGRIAGGRVHRLPDGGDGRGSGGGPGSGSAAGGRNGSITPVSRRRSAGSSPCAPRTDRDPARSRAARLRLSRPPRADDHLRLRRHFRCREPSFAVFDRDRSAESRQFVESFAGSRYFEQRPPMRSEDAAPPVRRLRLAIDIPPAFGRDLPGASPKVAFLLDGAMPGRKRRAAMSMASSSTRFDQARQAVGSRCRRTRSGRSAVPVQSGIPGAPWRSRPAAS